MSNGSYGNENDEPIKLVSPTPDHKGLVIEEEGLKLLRSITGPVAVVSIVGPQRGGKSTLLNLLHHRTPSGSYSFYISYIFYIFYCSYISYIFYCSYISYIFYCSYISFISIF